MTQRPAPLPSVGSLMEILQDILTTNLSRPDYMQGKPPPDPPVTPGRTATEPGFRMVMIASDAEVAEQDIQTYPAIAISEEGSNWTESADRLAGAIDEAITIKLRLLTGSVNRRYARLNDINGAHALQAAVLEVLVVNRPLIQKAFTTGTSLRRNKGAGPLVSSAQNGAATRLSPNFRCSPVGVTTAGTSKYAVAIDIYLTYTRIHFQRWPSPTSPGGPLP